MKALIVDDEPKAQKLLTDYINEYCTALELIEPVSNIKEALSSIQKNQPELVFLDIDMPSQNGFALFDYFSQIPFRVIFVTASRQHAIEAFKVSAIDYILKPINISELVKAVEKAVALHKPALHQQIQTLTNALSNNHNITRIAVSLNATIEFIQLKDLIYLKADGSYTEFYLLSDKKMVSSKPIGDYDLLQKHPHFFKTHRSFIVNMAQIERYTKDSGGYIVMKNGHIANLSRYKKDEFFKAMNYL